MEIRVLGPVEVMASTGLVHLPGRQRQLLAVLAVGAGTTCSVDALMDALWAEAPPASAAKLVQVYVSQLRHALGEGVWIVTRGNGYSLVDPTLLDATRFERLVADAATARRHANPALAFSLASRALALWRGAAYAEYAYEDFAREEADRLEELRLVATEERFDAGLELGRHAELLPELRAVSGDFPLRERVQGEAMVALYRCGRQADALAVYGQTRRHLRDDLGLDPSPALRDLQKRILEQDPTLDLAREDARPRPRIPVPPNPLLGRESELVEIAELLQRDEVRLLSLTGAGGSGKTRLALETAHRMAPSFANGVWWVDLAPLRDPALLVDAVLSALAVERDRASPPVDVLTAFLEPLELLLVLDNAEHLRETLPLLSELLAAAPRLTLLVTSRAVLHLSAEHVYPVQPLEADAAAALFRARARRADVRFDPDPGEQEAIALICARLDGLPLAIELAAAHTAAVPSSELLTHLDERLPLLTGGPRDVPARQQTLRATLAWSFDLLAENDRARAASLAVFVGSFDVEEATLVAGVDLDALERLVDQSLLQRTDDARFRYLETVREYALELLLGSADADEIRRSHFRFYLRLAEDADLSAVDRRGGERLDLAAAARDNLRSALAWSLETGSIALGLELATTMERYWVTHDPREGMRWFGELLRSPRAESVGPALRASALRAYGGATHIAGEADDARKLWEQSLALFEQLGDDRGRAVMLHRLGVSALVGGDLARARELVEASECIHERTGDRWGQAQTIATRGAIARDAGEAESARELIATACDMAREAGVLWWESGTLAELASLALQAGDVDEAESCAGKSLTIAEQIGDRGGCVFGVGLFAAIAARRGQATRAWELWRAVADEDAGAPLGGWRRHRSDIGEQLAQRLGQPEQVIVLTLDEAVAASLAGRARQEGEPAR